MAFLLCIGLFVVNLPIAKTLRSFYHLEMVIKMIDYTPKDCNWCKGTTRGDNCAMSVTCPSCKSEPSKSCYRPSGHRASELHADRIKLAQTVDDNKGFDWRAAFNDKAGA